jgi:HEPN domain-containing protein
VFILHQAAESFYYATLLVFTGYKPKTHNLYKLRKQAKHLSEELFLLFPIETNKEEKNLFDLLKRGYIDARYKIDYVITKEELNILIERIQMMKLIVEKICQEKIASLTGMVNP